MPPKKRKRNNVIGTDEVATDYKLQQFLEDVQKFTEKSKKYNENAKRNKKPLDDGNQACHKRGLFENGFRSKPFLKENKARLKSNLNDLVKECAKVVENKENHVSSNSQSTSERSYELGNQEVDKNNNNNVVPSGNEEATDENERKLCASEVPKKASNSLATIIKDRNQLKDLLWDKYCERMKCNQSLANIFPVVDHLKIAQLRINEMIYRTFLQHAKRYPSILQRIFSNDEIKRLAQVVVKDKVDKCVQTDFTVSDSVSNNIPCEMSTKKDNTLPFPHSSQNSCGDQNEATNFFDFNPSKKSDTRGVSFLESLENQPDIYSPGVQNTSPDCNVTPPPSPLPVNIRECWAPSTLSTPRKPEIFSPSISQIQHSFQKPSMSPPESLVINQPNPLTYRRRKKKSQLKFIQNKNILDSPQLCFPKRKRFAYSPHRL